jgi:hypothetical protein
MENPSLALICSQIWTATVAMLGCLVAHVTTLRRNCELVKVRPLFGDGPCAAFSFLSL